MEAETLAKVIDAVVDTIREHAAELTRLDQAIGDGDHGVNMKRGFDAVADLRAELSGLVLDAALQKIGMTLVMKVGGASGPLYGSLFLAMSKASRETPQSPAAASALLGAGIEAVKARGKSTVGEKTMLDVLVPVCDALAALDAPLTEAGLVRLRQVAEEATAATAPLRATKGRASFLGERSIGHVDPGARSSALIVTAVCDALQGEVAV